MILEYLILDTDDVAGAPRRLHTGYEATNGVEQVSHRWGVEEASRWTAASFGSGLITLNYKAKLHLSRKSCCNIKLHIKVGFDVSQFSPRSHR